MCRKTVLSVAPPYDEFRYGLRVWANFLVYHSLMLFSLLRCRVQVYTTFREGTVHLPCFSTSNTSPNHGRCTRLESRALTIRCVSSFATEII